MLCMASYKQASYKKGTFVVCRSGEGTRAQDQATQIACGLSHRYQGPKLRTFATVHSGWEVRRTEDGAAIVGSLIAPMPP
jgi:hypothetical protein